MGRLALEQASMYRATLTWRDTLLRLRRQVPCLSPEAPWRGPVVKKAAPTQGRFRIFKNWLLPRRG